MAKKTLTPEQAEIKAMKKEKSSQNWTKFWAIVLAAVLTVGVVFMGKTQADNALAAVSGDGNNDNAVVDQNNDASNGDDAVDFGDDSSNNDASNNDSSNNDASNNNASNNNSSNNTNNNTNNNNSQQSSQPSKADVAKALNDATAKASKASYSFVRTASFTKNIDVGSLTSILDGIIKGVDENADLNSVVGGFLGIKKDPISGEVKNGAGEGFDAKYMLKAMALTEADIQQAQVNGNTYKVQIKTCTNPDANSAWAHASDDYITFKEVNESIAGALGTGDTVKVLEDGSQAKYKDIVIEAVIENGNLTSLKYSYTFDATIKIKAVITATGTGAAKMENTYSNFKY